MNADFLNDKLEPAASEISDVWVDVSLGEILTNEAGEQSELLVTPTCRLRVTVTSEYWQVEARVRAELHRHLDELLDEWKQALLPK